MATESKTSTVAKGQGRPGWTHALPAPVQTLSRPLLHTMRSLSAKAYKSASSDAIIFMTYHPCFAWHRDISSFTYSTHAIEQRRLTNAEETIRTIWCLATTRSPNYQPNWP
jgi:hypothetical protein